MQDIYAFYIMEGMLKVWWKFQTHTFPTKEGAELFIHNISPDEWKTFSGGKEIYIGKM